MPLFDWSATSASTIVTRHFRIYWVVTIPLTLITVIVISIWIFAQEKKHEALSLAARDAIGGAHADPSLTGRSRPSWDLRSNSFSGSEQEIYTERARRKLHMMTEKIRQVFRSTFRRKMDGDSDEWVSNSGSSVIGRALYWIFYGTSLCRAEAWAMIITPKGTPCGFTLGIWVYEKFPQLSNHIYSCVKSHSLTGHFNSVIFEHHLSTITFQNFLGSFCISHLFLIFVLWFEPLI